ncbi:MAG: DUF1641 domain-containing protein [Alphaproteobacteria bacterium]|nr:DUF1641 domain-containing protein [Alphaproteobacteria bacterium]MBF0249542.1 DUF1641 domain-containing protein [Alphaproteobacteria bacterium]
MSNTQTENVLRLVEAASEAMTDGMVERLASTGGNALEILDRLNDPDTKEAILDTLERFKELHRTGAVDTLFELLILMHGARAALTDTLVERLVIWAESMINNIANEHLAEFAGETVDAMHEAAVETAGMKAGGGLMSTLAMLSKPETQQAIKFLMTFACKMQKNVSDAKMISRPD